MTHKHHRERHSKNRHFIGQDQIDSKKRMASLQPAEKLVVNEKIENANQVVEPAKQTSEVKTASTADISSTPPVMAQKIFQFEKKKNAFEKLKDKLHQLMNHFK